MTIFSDLALELWRWSIRGRLLGSNDGRLYGLALSDGTHEWEYEIGSSVSTSPAIASGRIVVGAQDGLIYCFG